MFVIFASSWPPPVNLNSSSRPGGMRGAIESAARLRLAGGARRALKRGGSRRFRHSCKLYAPMCRQYLVFLSLAGFCQPP